jgi:hypothetical protein
MARYEEVMGYSREERVEEHGPPTCVDLGQRITHAAERREPDKDNE